MRELRILITGGGTGGHAVPAVAVARAIQEKQKESTDWQPVFRYVGSRNGVEARLAKEAGLDFVGIESGKLRRSHNVAGLFRWANIVDAFRVPVGVLQALAEVYRFRPDVLLSTGGYVSVPPVIAAWALRRPILAHEQTVQIGLANRIIARFATRMAVTFPESIEELPRGLRKKCFVTGNPIRPILFSGDSERAIGRFGFDPADDSLPTIYITGGAQGSRLINRAVQENLGEILGLARVIHQCGQQPAGGEQDFDCLSQKAQSLAPKLSRRYYLTRFVGDEIGDVYALASLIVGRSGAGTVTEVCALGKPALFVPLVPTGGDEQTRNARRLEQIDAAVVIRQEELTGARLLSELTRLLSNSTKL
ncbi:MAG TPA: UDP-N-acetylglucosamine--N-acetylmuramyl-(pentapeptide) pyrophosphoryl-undecaprenol N-acetylglucosamine transferase [Capsulimonadaceae bacterium]|nr:UDP-N-acetylglucosamine--N-acetylmuramyl-(pentapeptide) pyrophosphoryl-undecaprenol N-acetylglucosamine transferase [Capsulimonadaceae bacterium]